MFKVNILQSRKADNHLIKWQARRDSNPHHPDLESGALAVRATGLHFALLEAPAWEHGVIPRANL